jgi:hypothetical protein
VEIDFAVWKMSPCYDTVPIDVMVKIIYDVLFRTFFPTLLDLEMFALSIARLGIPLMVSQ